MLTALAIDAAFDYLAVSLEWEGGRIDRFTRTSPAHSERLMPMVDSILSEAGLAPGDIGLVACMEGPGSFTGLRIAMSAAKGISLGTGCPLVAVPSMDALAYGREGFEGTVVPLVDAKRDSFYAAFYRGGRLLRGPEDVRRAALLGAIAAGEATLLTGPGAALAMADAAAIAGVRLDPLHSEGRCAAVLALARAGLAAGKAAADGAAPVYLRKSDAEEALERKLAAGTAASGNPA